MTIFHCGYLILIKNTKTDVVVLERQIPNTSPWYLTKKLDMQPKILCHYSCNEPNSLEPKAAGKMPVLS